MARRRKQLGLLLALCCTFLPLWHGMTGAQKSADKNEFFKGQVVPLDGVLAKANIKMDADAVPYWLVLQTEQGKLYPLLKDNGSRMLFKDAKLLSRAMRLTARQIPQTQLLQVIQLHSYVKGKLHDVFYWCDVCAIKRFESGNCDCCGAPLELREVPSTSE